MYPRAHAEQNGYDKEAGDAGEGDDEGHARSDHYAAEDVAPELVGAHQVGETVAHQRLFEVLLAVVVGGDEVGKDGGKQQHDHNDEAHRRERLFPKQAYDEVEPAVTPLSPRHSLQSDLYTYTLSLFHAGLTFL